jgi:hypothetical protein
MRQASIRRSRIAWDAVPRSNLRRVTTRFFGKSVKTRKMAARLPILPALWILAVGPILAGGCGRAPGTRTAGPADGSSAAVSSGGFAPASGGRRPGASPAGRGSPVPLRGPNDEPAGSPRGQAILEAAVQALDSRRCVSARIRQQVDMFGKQLVGSGVYFQEWAGGDYLIRLELRIQVGDRVSSLLQVLSPPSPEGRYLWTCRKMPGDEKLTRIDVVRATRALEKAENTPRLGPEGSGVALGGLPKLLRNLQAAFDFDSAQQGRFGRLPVWRLQGRWKPERLGKILPEQKAAIEAGEPPDLNQLPEHLPDCVVLMLGQEDLFPYRIEYRRGIAGKAGRQDASRALVTMELFDVKLDVPIDRTRFIYNPGNMKFSDETDSLLSSLGATR